MFFAIDGGNSCKRRYRAGSGKEVPFNNTYFISNAEVDRFKDEVKGRKQKEREVDSNLTVLEVCTKPTQSAIHLLRQSTEG